MEKGGKLSTMGPSEDPSLSPKTALGALFPRSTTQHRHLRLPLSPFKISYNPSAARPSVLLFINQTGPLLMRLLVRISPPHLYFHSWTLPS